MVHIPKLTQTYTSDAGSTTVSASRLNTVNYVTVSANNDFTITTNIDKSDVDEGAYWLMEVINMESNTSMADQPRVYASYNSTASFTGVQLRDPATQGDILVKMASRKYSTLQARDGVIASQNPDQHSTEFLGYGQIEDYYRNFEIRVNSSNPTGNNDVVTANTVSTVSSITTSVDEGLSEYIRLVANAKTVANTLKDFGEGSDAFEAADTMMAKLLELLDVYLNAPVDGGKLVKERYETLSALVEQGVNDGIVPRFEVFYTNPLNSFFDLSIFSFFGDSIASLQAQAEADFETTVEEIAEKLFEVTKVLDKGSTVVSARFYDDVFEIVNNATKGVNATVDAIQEYDNGSLPGYIEADAVAATNEVISFTDTKITQISATSIEINNKMGDMIITLQDIVDRYNLG